MVSVYKIINSLLQVYIYIIIIRALVSWFSPNPDNSFWRFLCELTEPPLQKIRDFLPRNLMIDFSPIILIILISFLQRLLRMIFYSSIEF